MSVALATFFAASFDIRHSTFTAHSAHSRNIISGTPEREWSEWDERFAAMMAPVLSENIGTVAATSVPRT
jgi:hypothetical protein